MSYRDEVLVRRRNYSPIIRVSSYVELVRYSINYGSATYIWSISGVKGVCYGPGHEKYPSWPSAPERHPDEDVHGSGHSGSHRSKSWTDHTNYPKEKPAQYTRPHTKRPNPAFTQQVRTFFLNRMRVTTVRNPIRFDSSSLSSPVYRQHSVALRFLRN